MGMIADDLISAGHILCGLVELSLIYASYDVYVRGTDIPVNSTPFYYAVLMFMSKLMVIYLLSADDLLIYYTILLSSSLICLYFSWRYSTAQIPILLIASFLLILCTMVMLFSFRRIDLLKVVEILTSLGLIASPLASLPHILQDQSSVYLSSHFIITLTLYTFINLIISITNNNFYSFLLYFLGVICIGVQILLYTVYYDTYYYQPIPNRDRQSLTVYADNGHRRRSIDLIELGQNNHLAYSTPPSSPPPSYDELATLQSCLSTHPEGRRSMPNAQSNAITHFHKVPFSPQSSFRCDVSPSYDTYEPYQTPASLYLGGDTPSRNSGHKTEESLSPQQLDFNL